MTPIDGCPVSIAGSPLCFHQRDVLEIQGPSSSGKSLLLSYLLAHCICPSDPALVHKGWGMSAVILDTEGTFDLSTVRRLLFWRLNQTSESDSDDSCQLRSLVETALQNLHIFCPNSSAQILFTLIDLFDYIAHSSPEKCVGLIVIDSISSFYWPDKLTDELTRVGAQPGTTNLHRIISQIHHLRNVYNPLLVLTNWTLAFSASNVPVPLPLYRQHLSPFPTINPEMDSNPRRLCLTHRISLSLAFEDEQVPCSHHGQPVKGFLQIHNSAATQPFLWCIGGHS
jgi:DNA-repair protein XRCC2